MYYYNVSASKISSIVIINFIVFFSGAAYSNSLTDVYNTAAKNNLTYQSSLLDYQISQEELNEVAAGYDTQLSLKVNPEFNLSSTNPSGKRNIDFALSLSKPLYRKQLSARVSQASAVVHRERVVLEQEKQKLIERVTSLYLNYAASQNKLKYSLKEQGLLKQRLNQTRLLFKAQLATSANVNQAKLTLNRSYQATSEINSELQNFRRELQIETGAAYSNLAELSDNSTLPGVQPRNLKRWIELANSYNHELIIARINLQIQSKGVRVNQEAGSTSVDLFANYNLTDESDNQGGTLGLEFNMPLYSGDQDASKVRNSKLEYQKSHTALNIKKREISQNIRLQFFTALNGLKVIQMLISNLAITEKELSNVERSRAAGTRTISDVLSTKSDLLLIKRSYNEAKYKYLIDLIKLKLLAGVLSIDDLNSIDRLLKSNNSFATQAALLGESFNNEENLQSLEDAWGTN